MHKLSGAVNKLTGDGNLNISSRPVQIEITFKLDRANNNIPDSNTSVQNIYKKVYNIGQKITSVPSGHERDANRGEPNTYYDITINRYCYNELVHGKKYPYADSSIKPELFLAKYGTGVRKLFIGDLKQDYVFVGSNIKNEIWNLLSSYENADRNKLEVIKDLDTSKPSELKDPNNVTGDILSRNTKLKFFGAEGLGNTSSIDELVKSFDIKVVNKVSFPSSISLDYDFSDNLGYKENGEYKYTDLFKVKIESALKDRFKINNQSITVYLDDKAALENSKNGNKTIYVNLGELSDKSKELKGFSVKGANFNPEGSENISQIKDELINTSYKLYDNGKLILDTKNGIDPVRRIGDTNKFMVGQYLFDKSNPDLRIGYRIGYNENVPRMKNVKFDSGTLTVNKNDIQIVNNKKVDIRTNKLFVENNKIGKTGNSFDNNGIEIKNSDYFTKLFISSLPKISNDGMIDYITVEDTTDYDNNCVDGVCQKIDFEPAVDENKPRSESRLKNPYLIKSKVTIKYKNGYNLNDRVYNLESNLDIIIREKKIKPDIIIREKKIKPDNIKVDTT